MRLGQEFRTPLILYGPHHLTCFSSRCKIYKIMRRRCRDLKIERKYMCIFEA